VEATDCISSCYQTLRLHEKQSIERKTFQCWQDDTEAEHTAPLHYCDTHWLSRAKVLHRVFELKEESATFVSVSNNNYDTNLFYNEGFIQKPAYLVNIFEKLSNMTT
jgi:hypothetical protein